MDSKSFPWLCRLWVLLVVLSVLSGKALAKDQAAPPFQYVWGQAYHVLPESHSGSGYFSLCEGLNGKIYVGTAKYGVNSYLVEFDPKTEKQRIVIDTHKVCGLTGRGYAAQAKIHTRNFVGPSGKIYVGSMEGSRKSGDTSEYPGGYVMTYDPKTDVAESLGMPYRGQGVIDVVADEGRGIIYVVPLGATKPWTLYDMKTKQYRKIGPVLTVFATTLIDRRGYASAITKDYRLAQYDPESGKVTVRDIVVDGKKVTDLGASPEWILSADGRTAYLIQMEDPTLYEIDLLSEGEVVEAKSHGKMIEGKNADSRASLSAGPDGRVYAVVGIDNETGFGVGVLHHLVRFDPQTKEMEDLGVLAVENPDFFFHSPGAVRRHPAISTEEPPYYGYYTLPDGTLTVHSRSDVLAMKVTRDGTIYTTILYPFTLLRIDEFKPPKSVGLPAGSITAYGGQITFYDTDADTLEEVDVRPLAVVSGNDRVGITQVVLQEQYSEFGVVIEQKHGSNTSIAILDHTFHPMPIRYIVADANVSLLSLGSNLLGMDLNGVSLGAGVDLAPDIDGDGVVDDAVGFVGLGNVRTIRSSARIEGDVVVTGDLGRLNLVGSYAVLDADLSVGGDLGLLRSTRTISGAVRVDGDIRRILALGGTDAEGSIEAGSGLNYLLSRGDLLGGVNVTGDAGIIRIVGGDLDSDVVVEGSLVGLRVLGGTITSNGTADPRVQVGGTLGQLLVVGPDAGNAIQDDIDVDGLLGRVVVKNGDFNGDLTAGSIGALHYLGPTGLTNTITSQGNLNRLAVRGGIGEAGVVDVSGHIGTLISNGNVRGSIEAGLGFGRLWMGGDLTGADISVGGLFARLTVLGDYQDSDVEADRLGVVRVRGQISGTGHIRAHEGAFLVSDADEQSLVVDALGYEFDNVHAFVEP